MKKTIIAVVSLIVICFTVLFAAKYVLDYSTDKVFDEIAKNIENVQIEPVTEQNSLKEKDVSGDEAVLKEENSKTDNISENKPVQKEETETSKTEKAVRTVSSLTSQQLKEIQEMVTVTDRLAVINICKAALTKEDKKEIKQMLSSGTIDFGRCKEILSLRLSASQKQQIYAYYEKYINMYFNR